MRRALAGIGVAVALTACLGFLALPIVAIFLRVPPGDLVDRLGDETAREALLLTLQTSAVANAVLIGVGTPAAYALARRSFPGRRLLLTLVELPLVLPPAVAGIGLLAAFGANGLLGSELGALGLRLPFTTAAVILAVLFVAGPLYVRQAVAAFEAVDQELVDAARTLGAGPARAAVRVALPLAAPGLAAGWALAFARGLGEFGATLIFAGSIAGVSRTLTLEIYASFATDLAAALAVGALLVCLSAAILISVKLIPNARWLSSPASTSR